ncbi:RAMP superfamily CRISPR-associated protein [Streptomyces sp. NBC_01635]|uniref:RAMP superfamily CRISPR-associated protein n=1 Tax=Streptomyces sp. NBC_01635 TaxID=2975904 RepID=UPI00386ADEE8|nr:RAMP superfamily CRISPR-associated protein [Streptomyces sp. NBC_01635]WTD79545.1 RAMP superfamily CRISPR-associated protein [Streptomyces sp. NBC_01635]
MTGLTVTVTMLGDWHVGTGAGRHGLVDRSVQRDADGLPYIPAKTLAGVWRDGCEAAAHALDGGTPGPWHAWVEYLFGSQPALEARGVLPPSGDGAPRSAALQVDSLHYSPAVVAALRGPVRHGLRAAAVFLKPGVALDPHTGHVREGMLRFEEMARGGVRLVGRAELTGFEDLDAHRRGCAAALLAAGARLVEGLGGKRRRGAGRCRIDFTGVDVDLDLLGEPDPPSPSGPAASPAPAPLGQQGAAEAVTEWEVAGLRFVLRRPLIAHARTVGNTVRSSGQVPGGTLLPEVLRRLGGPRTARAARDGDLIVTDATVEVAGQRGLPVPLVLTHTKADRTRATNRLLDPEASGGLPYEEQWAAPYTPGAALAVAGCPRSEHTHNTILDEHQRPTEEVGGLYVYEAIAAGAVLRAEVRVPRGLLPQGWERRLEGEWRLGRARKDGYGLTDVTAHRTIVPPAPATRPAPEGRLRVWLLSPVLVPDSRLRPSTDPADLAAVLGRTLGAELRPVPDERATEPQRSDPWHSRWGLPRASLLGLRAGSCLTFTVTAGTVTAEAVRRVELSGIGLRRAEGFGQLRIDDPLLHTPELETVDHGTSPDTGLASEDASGVDLASGTASASPDIALTAEDDTVLAVVEEGAWRAAIRRHCETLAADPRSRTAVLGAGHASVPATQLGALLTLVTDLDEPGGVRVGHWLARLKRMRGIERRKPWPTAVTEAVEKLLTTPDRVWDLLALPEGELTAHTGQTAHRKRRAALRERLWGEAVRTLVEDCLTAHRRAAEDKEGPA